MKIQFCRELFDPRFNDDVIAEFDVAEEPTEEQCEEIKEELFAAVDDWYEENDGDMSEFDWWGVCYEVAKKHLEMVDNPVVKTFYL